MWKRVAFLVLLIIVPVGVASLVQSNASRREAAENPPPAPPITVSSGHTEGEILFAAVDRLLSESADSWNAGDLDGFLVWYVNDPRTTYIGGSGLVNGWEGIRARYAPQFEADAERDSLRFEELEARALGPGLGLATARYVLFGLEGETTSTGMFTLVLEERPEGWRITHDHSSADAN